MTSRPRILASLLVVLLTATLTVLLGSSAAQASSRWCHYGKQSGICYETVGNFVRQKVVVEAVPLINKTRKTGEFSCTFSKTISESQSFTKSVTAKAGAKIYGIVDVEISGTLSKTIEQTGSQASAASASYRLKPGEKVICQRIYSSYVQKVKETRWSGPVRADYNTTTRMIKTTVPSTLGIRVVD